MSEAKFTPGPWIAWQPRGDESVPVRTDGLGITIAYAHQGAITNARANAHLIAAAPELYDLLESFPGFTNDCKIGDPWIEKRDEILAKARGEV